MATILFIEDDPLILKIYSTRLAADGHEVITASNGEDGVTLAIEKMPKLIVLDIMMPRMDGFAVLSKLRSQPAMNNIPILVYSNLGREEEMARAKELGATEAVIKANISPTEMVNKIKSYLPKGDSPQPPQQSQQQTPQVSPPSVGQNAGQTATQTPLPQQKASQPASDQTPNPGANS